VLGVVLLYAKKFLSTYCKFASHSYTMGLFKVAFYPRRKRLEKLQYVDQYIIKLASEGMQYI